jgi:hypothetical protein
MPVVMIVWTLKLFSGLGVALVTWHLLCGFQ